MTLSPPLLDRIAELLAKAKLPPGRDLCSYAASEDGAAFLIAITNAAESLIAEARASQALRVSFERECADADRILEKLGIGVERGRTDGGSLHVTRILNHIQETLDALSGADAASKHFTAKHAEATRENKALRVECEGLRKDAERYRWLRNHSANQWEHPVVVSQRRAAFDTMQYIGPLIGESLDAAIDRVRGGG